MRSGRRAVKRIARWAAVAGVLACARDAERATLPPIVVTSPYQLPAVVVRGAERDWWRLVSQPVHYDEPLPVGVTMYCLSGTTRRGRWVRPGIVAADPRLFPLARFIELYVGEHYLGRFLVDDTGQRIRGARIDVWNASCTEARRFGLQRGTAVLVRRPPKLDVRLAGHPGAGSAR